MIRTGSVIRASLGTLLLTIALSAYKLPAGHISAAPAGDTAFPSTLSLGANQIPRVPGPLPVMKLSPQPAPVDFIKRLLPAVAPRADGLASLSSLPFYQRRGIKTPQNLIGAFNGDHLAAYVDLTSGDAEVFPTLGTEPPVPANELPSFLERAGSVGQKTFQSQGLIARDDTTAVIDSARPLNGQTKTLQGITRQGGAVLAVVPVERYVGKFRVDGPGSRALLAVDARGHIQSFVRSWNAGKTFTTVTETRSTQQVAAAIAAQFKPILSKAFVNVTSVAIGYYDGNAGSLQPVYRFTARIHYGPATNNRHVDDDFAVGYVGIGKQFERLPVIEPLGGSQPAQPKASVPSIAPAGRDTATRGSGFDPLVGRYVVRDDDSNFVSEANEFYGGLTSFGGGLFSNAQYYWAEPFEFESLRNSFINSVNIANIQVHGDWWLFSTEKNCCDLVGLNDIPSPGYSAAAGGKLDYWIIRSCEVVPAPDDTAAWADPWWHIFGGLHSVVGFRTIAYIDDDVDGPYGLALRLGAPVVGAWLNAAMSAPIYGHDTMVMHGVTKLLGRPSAITMSGRDNDSAYDTTALPRAGSLTIYWYPG